jgi:hypothetical protein
VANCAALPSVLRSVIILVGSGNPEIFKSLIIILLR